MTENLFSHVTDKNFNKLQPNVSFFCCWIMGKQPGMVQTDVSYRKATHQAK